MTDSYEGFAIIELFGRTRHAGYVRPVTQYGAEMLRLDVPADEESGRPGSTHFYGGSAVYCLTPSTEEMVKAVCKRDRPAPVAAWELPRPAVVDAEVVNGFDDDDDDDHCADCGRPLNSMGDCSVCP